MFTEETDNYIQIEFTPTEKSTPMRLSVSWLMLASLRALLKPFGRHDSVVQRGLRAAHNWSPLCREALVSRTNDKSFPVWLFTNN